MQGKTIRLATGSIQPLVCYNPQKGRKKGEGRIICYLPYILTVIGFVGGSLRSQSFLSPSLSFGNQGVHNGVAKWDIRSRVAKSSE